MEKTKYYESTSTAELDFAKARRAKLELNINRHRSFEINKETADTDHVIKNIRYWTIQEPVSKHNYSIIKIQTNSGLVGYGECAAITAGEFDEAKKVAINLPVTSYEVAGHLLSKYPRALAGLNIAMLDALGKATKAPLYQVLGGPTRAKSRALTTLTGNTDAALLSSMKRARSAGYKAFSVPVPAAKFPNSGQALVMAVVQRLKSLREAGGQDVDFVLDGGNRLSPGDAQMITTAIEPFHVLWFNEPCVKVGLDSLGKISRESVVPLGLGQHATKGTEIQDLLREDTVDIIRPEIGLNGISQIRRMATLAETYYIAVGPSHNGGPVGTAAALHLAASIPNFFIQHIPFPEAQADQEMRLKLTTSPVEIIKDGFAELPTGHGLGLTVNEKSLDKYKIS